MNVVARHRIMSIEDFLAWEARQELKFEFDGFEPVAMAGGTRNHASVQRNLAISIGGRLRGTACGFYGSDLKLLTGSQSRYPDGQVLCGETDGEARFVTTPVVLFEVASPSTEQIDRVQKAMEYRQIATVFRYVILAQDRVGATVHARTAAGWTTSELASGMVLHMPEIGLDVPLTELYDGVTFAKLQAAE